MRFTDLERTLADIEQSAAAGLAELANDNQQWLDASSSHSEEQIRAVNTSLAGRMDQVADIAQLARDGVDSLNISAVDFAEKTDLRFSSVVRLSDLQQLWAFTSGLEETLAQLTPVVERVDALDGLLSDEVLPWLRALPPAEVLHDSLEQLSDIHSMLPSLLNLKQASELEENLLAYVDGEVEGARDLIDAIDLRMVAVEEGQTRMVTSANESHSQLLVISDRVDGLISDLLDAKSTAEKATDAIANDLQVTKIKIDAHMRNSSSRFKSLWSWAEEVDERLKSTADDEEVKLLKEGIEDVKSSVEGDVFNSIMLLSVILFITLCPTFVSIQIYQRISFRQQRSIVTSLRKSRRSFLCDSPLCQQ